ncbi:Ada metal-binding domain-containing protein [Methanobrevibacter sp.]|uniref:Ada metal-binding domain-containing protein n=1 Tax=Methanobrevibacter sp. TaxID=66852 RepID=UPI0025CD7B04|nr:Ada metal-binding domain-containing protein [Methanobrevibacter sp.]MBQ2962607.1 hypothetical protein [Methanobrevibacter sp.]
MKINFKNFFMGFILILLLISALNIVSAYDIDLMEIEGGCISTGGGLEDKTYAIIYVGEEYSGADVLIQIFYSRDGSQLNPGNKVQKTVDDFGCIEVRSANAFKYFPDFAEINLYDSNGYLIDSRNETLLIDSGNQTFGDFDLSDYSSRGTVGSSSSGSTTTYHSGTSNSYVGNGNTGKFHAPGCDSVDKMKPSNKVYFSSRDEAINRGYSPCQRCYP